VKKIMFTGVIGLQGDFLFIETFHLVLKS